MSKVTITKSKLDNLANAVSAKSGEPVLLTVDEMTDAVLGINTGEENVLEGVKVNGQELPIVNKKVNIPAVTETQAGVMTPAYMNQIYNGLQSIPTKVSDLPNDAGYITTETDPTVPSWAKQSTKPTYTASEVGALPDTTVIPGTFIIRYNNTTGTADKTYTEIDTAKDLGYTILLQDNSTSFYTLTSSNLGYLFTSIDDLSTVVPSEGSVVKIKQIKVNSSNNWIERQSYKLPIKVSDLTNDSGFITTETDPTVPSWAKQSTKPTYTATEVGAVATSAVGAASGVAPLNASSKIDETYLPSYVDDVIEGYLYNGSFYKESTHTTVIPGEAGKIYVDLATDKTYRYGGSTFVEISSGTTVSVSRDLTSGTKVGTITVNGTGTDFYAPTPPTVVSQLTNDSGYITTETDPVYSASAAASITSGNITAWNGKATCHYVTVTESGETLSADATYQQIATWISNNDIVIVVYEGSNYYYAYLFSQGYYFYNNQGPSISIFSDGIYHYEEYYAIGNLNEYVHNEYFDDGVNAVILDDGEDGSSFIRQRYSDSTRAEVRLSNNSNTHSSDISLTADEVGFYTDRLYINSDNYTPTQDNDITTKEYVDDSISSISIPTKTSDLTNDSGYIATETDPTVPSWAKASSKPSYSLSEISGTDDLQSIEGISGTSGLLKKTAANTWSLDTNTYLTSYTETDPIFAASPAAGITSADITSWNNKISDTGKWNNVSLTKSQVDTGGADILIPYMFSTSATEAKLVTAGDSVTAKTIAIRDGSGYIKANTPPASDNSTKVATTEYVNAAIPTVPTNVSSFTNDAGYLTLATLPIYDGTVV